MEHLSDNLLSNVERFTGYFGPLTTLFDSIVERIAPKTRAQAACGGYYCYSGCQYNTCFLWWRVRIDYYVADPSWCSIPGEKCMDFQPCGTC